MILYVKNKLEIGEGSFVVDENGEKKFEVAGKVFSITRKKFVQNLNGETLYMVRNKYWHAFTKKALIYDGKTKEKVAKIKERFFGRGYIIVDCEDEITMESLGFGKGFDIFKNGNKIGSWLPNWEVQGVADVFRSSYKVDVVDDADAPFIVALIIAIDNIRDSKRRDRD